MVQRSYQTPSSNVLVDLPSYYAPRSEQSFAMDERNKEKRQVPLRAA
jgi:hypothetical protein